MRHDLSITQKSQLDAANRKRFVAFGIEMAGNAQLAKTNQKR